MTAAPIASSFPAIIRPDREKLDQSSVIRQVALLALKDLALALAITLICTPFTASGAWVMMGGGGGMYAGYCWYWGYCIVWGVGGV